MHAEPSKVAKYIKLSILHNILLPLFQPHSLSIPMTPMHALTHMRVHAHMHTRAHTQLIL